MNARKAFTLIELLVVIAIMVTIAGMILATMSALGIGSKRTKTATILETVRQALEVTNAQVGSIPAPVEHPLAGSYGAAGQPRLAFVRDDASHTPLATTVSGTFGSSSEGIALSGVELTNLPPGHHARLMLPRDIYADRQVPLLYGMRREFLTVLGGKQANVTRYRRLPRQLEPTTVIANPNDLVAYPNAEHLVMSTDGPEANKRTIDYVLGNTNASTELARAGALYTPPDDLAANLLAFGRVWSSVPQSEPGAEQWKPGLFNDPQRSPPGSAAWKPYRLRGLAIYDAWGHEILCSVSKSGGIRLMSAGKDGAFRWFPGENDTIETDAWATDVGGDDRDGSSDNVVSNIGGD